VKVNMNYFYKNGKLHKLPVPLRCSAIREGERIHAFIPRDSELCPDCFTEEERREQGHE